MNAARIATRIFRRAWNQAVRIARLAIGVPDYATFVRHLRTHHPERAVPSYVEFFRACQERRYRGTRGCC
jgi:uncharacterized short protein YbdD (DUF466 family)